MSRGSRMTEHPRVLVEAARLQWVGERSGVQRRGFGVGAGFGVSPREMDRIARQMIEEQNQLAEMDALAR